MLNNNNSNSKAKQAKFDDLTVYCYTIKLLQGQEKYQKKVINNIRNLNM